MPERWKQIEHFEGYEVSDQGRVRSWWAPTRGRRKRREQPALIAGSHGSGNSPYLRICVTHAGRKYTRRIHQCVLTAFVGPRPSGQWGLHNDGDLLNNDLGNLRWGTPKENADDRSRHGRTMLGPVNHKSKLTPDQVRIIREVYGSGAANQVQLARLHGVSQASVSAVLRGKSWAHTQ